MNKIDKIDKIYKTFEKIGKMDANECTPAVLSGIFDTVFEISEDSYASDIPLIDAVGRGSNEYRGLNLSYTGNNAEVETVILGKGITYDTGGLNVKPGIVMNEMSYDKLGACIVIALGKLGPNVASGIAIAENAIGSSAYKPGCVIKTAKGYRNVRVTHTDAEGRLVLADGIVQAQALYPNLKRIVTIATLTGATYAFFGQQCVPVFTNEALKGLFRSDLETIIHLKIHDEDKRSLVESKTILHNSANDGNRGAFHGAAFLDHFVKPGVELIHYDIAGFMPKNWKTPMPKRLVVATIENILANIDLWDI